MNLNHQNIVILTIGRSGSTILCRILEQLGWQLPNVDEFAEHREFVRFNEMLLRGLHPCEEELSGFAERLPEPWILKDPRFLWTHQHWQLLHGSLLLWIERDLNAVERSLRRQQWGRETARGWMLRGHTMPEHQDHGEHIFQDWSGPKLRIEYEDLQRAALLFTGPSDTHRSCESETTIE